jgi:hypothetical protein
MARNLPHESTPLELRRAIQRLGVDTDYSISSIQSDIAGIESDITSIDSRVEALEETYDGNYEAEAAEDIAAGLPLYSVSGFANAGLARADTQSKARVVGFARCAALTGFTVEIIGSGRLYLADWTAVVGSASLVPGAVYYLDDTGGIASIAPSAGSVTEVGQAVETTVLDVKIKRPILL